MWSEVLSELARRRDHWHFNAATGAGLMQAPLMAHWLPSASSGMGVALMRWGA